MKKTTPRKLQLQRMTIRMLERQLDHVAGGLTTTENYSLLPKCSQTCMCSEPCTNSCRPCVG